MRLVFDYICLCITPVGLASFFFFSFLASTSKALPPLPAGGMKFRGSNQVLTESVSGVVLEQPEKQKNMVKQLFQSIRGA